MSVEREGGTTSFETQARRNRDPSLICAAFSCCTRTAHFLSFQCFVFVLIIFASVMSRIEMETANRISCSKSRKRFIIQSVSSPICITIFELLLSRFLAFDFCPPLIFLSLVMRKPKCWGILSPFFSFFCSPLFSLFFRQFRFVSLR